MNQDNTDSLYKIRQNQEEQITPDIQANSDVKKIVKSFEEKSAKYETLKLATGILAQRGRISPEMLAKLKQATEQYLEECVAQEMKTYLHEGNAKQGIRGKLRSARRRWTSRIKLSSRNDEKQSRIKRNKWLAGVCSGLGEYFQIDPTIIRALFVVGFIPPFTLISIAIYAVLIYMLPLKYSQEGIKKSRLARFKSLWTPAPKAAVN